MLQTQQNALMEGLTHLSHLCHTQRQDFLDCHVSGYTQKHNYRHFSSPTYVSDGQKVNFCPILAPTHKFFPVNVVEIKYQEILNVIYDHGNTVRVFLLKMSR